MSEAVKTQPPKRFRSLTVTLTLAFLALSLSVLFVSTGLEIYFRYQTQKIVIRNQQLLVAQHAANMVQSFVEDKLRVLAQAADLNDLAISSERRDVLGNKLLGRDSSFRQLFLVDADGKELATASRLSGLTSSPLFGREEPLLVAVLKGKSYISSVYIDERTNEPLVLIAVPAMDIFREPKGALIAEINLKFMWDLVENIHVGDTGLAYVVDKQGNLLAFTDTTRVLAHENLTTIQAVGHFASNVSHTGQEDKISTGIQGVAVVSTFVALGTPDWAVVVEMPVLEAYSAVVGILGYSLLIMLFSAVFAVASGVYLSRRITGEIINLSTAAQELSSGKLDTRVKIPSQVRENEIGRLAAFFNTMAGSLQELYTGMDKKVQEKTVQLSEQVTEVNKSKSAILNLLEDIDAEKKRAEEMVVVRTRELSDEKPRLLASINSLSFGFALVNSEDQILLQNPVLKKVLEFSAEPKTIHDITELFKAADSKIDLDIAGSCKRCMELKEPVEFKEVPYGKKFLRIICAPILAKEVTIGYVFLVEDITEAKVMERSREEFFSIASHELRTPLTAIRGNASMLQEFYGDKLKDPEIQEMLADMLSASERLIRIVNDFLDVSRIEQGRLELKKEQIDLVDMIEKTVQEFQKLAGSKKLSLTFAPPQAPPPKALIDKDRTKQVLVNFIGNALNYTKAGHITLTLAHEGQSLTVRVTDSGGGIPLANQSLLFHKFQQAGDPLARDVSQSTGLGLYISKLINENMGGAIGLEESEQGKGSTFFFSVPIAA